MPGIVTALQLGTGGSGGSRRLLHTELLDRLGWEIGLGPGHGLTAASVLAAARAELGLEAPTRRVVEQLEWLAGELGVATTISND